MEILLGSHVGMSGKDMFLGSVKEALSYGANTFMVYTGAPQNTRRKGIDELNITQAKQLMKENNIETFVVHAPYIINLANSIKEETFKLGVEFLEKEIVRTEAMGSNILVLHPGSHVGEGTEAGIKKIVEGLDEVLSMDTTVKVALETMAGKGSEVGKSFEELAKIIESCKYPEKLRVCFDTCHVNDAGYDIVNDYEKVMDEFDRIVGIEKISAFHINDSKNELGSKKDRHENIGKGKIGIDALLQVIVDKRFEKIPKILETPYYKDEENGKKTRPPYKDEIEMIYSNINR